MRAIITGAASGIGRAVAFKLAGQAVGRGDEVSLMLVDLNCDKLDTASEELQAAGAEVATWVGDLARPDSAQAIVDATEEAFGGLDVLVSNAGIIQRAHLLDLTVEQFDQAFAVNTRATWLLARAAHPLLAKSKGCIIATASLSATQPTPPLGAYSASKAALLMLVRQMSVEWGPDGIRCNCVSPGSTHTAMTDARYSNPELRAEAAKKNPLQTVGLPEHQAGAVAFLASPEAAYVTGENIIVDGGLQNMLMPASGMGDPWNR